MLAAPPSVRTFEKLAAWTSVATAKYRKALTRAGKGLNELEDVFGDEPEEVFVHQGDVHLKDVTLQSAGDYPGVFVIDGNLAVAGMLSYGQTDGGSILYVTGSITAGDLAIDGSANLWVGKDLRVAGTVLGFLTDAGTLVVHGKLSAATFIECYGRASMHVNKPALQRFVRWDDEEVEGFPAVTLAKVALIDRFAEDSDGDAMRTLLARGKPVVDAKKLEAAGTAATQSAKTTTPAKPRTASAEVPPLEVDLSEKNLAELPKTLFAKPVTRLVIGGRRLAKIPADLGKMTTLQSLEINGTDATSLPASIGKLPRLRRLAITRCASLKLPDALVSSAIRELELGPFYGGLPPVVAKMSQLERLHLWGESSGRLQTFPAEILALTQLRGLRLRWHTFEAIPAALLELVHLEELELFGVLGNVKKLPVLGKLRNLKSLKLWGNAAGRVGDKEASATLLEAVRDLPRLESLDLGVWNPEAISACLARVATMPELRVLRLSGKVDSWPDAMFELPHLGRITGKGVKLPARVKARLQARYPNLQIDLTS